MKQLYETRMPCRRDYLIRVLADKKIPANVLRDFYINGMRSKYLIYVEEADYVEADKILQESLPQLKTIKEGFFNRQFILLGLVVFIVVAVLTYFSK